MTGSEQREAARQFINRWRGKGKEDEDGRSYWIELFFSLIYVYLDILDMMLSCCYLLWQAIV